MARTVHSAVRRLRMYARFACHLRKLLRTPLSLSHCQAVLRTRLARREESLLGLVRAAIFNHPGSPYLALFRRAGCTYGDLEKLVRADGALAALAHLRREGVYLSAEEWKGKRPVVRGELSFTLNDEDLDNPLVLPQLDGRSGGSRSAGTRTNFDLSYLESGRAVYNACLFDVLGTRDLPHVLWASITPGFGPLELLACAKVGKPPVRWFSPVESSSFRQPLNYRLATNYIVQTGNLLGAHMPPPEYVSVDGAGHIAEWLAGLVRVHGGCSIETYTSNAVRIAQAARARGLDLQGTRFIPTGEPLTPAKRQEIEASGGTACTRYAFSEGGYVSMGCLRPGCSDDSHLLDDSLALIQHERPVPYADVTVPAFLFTSLLPCTPKILFNVENGDYGVVEQRACGCGLGALGFTTHVSQIRGFDKLTGEGMTFIGTDLLHVLEHVLPARFGGSSTDYQLVEEEDERGQTRVILFINPALAGVTETTVREILLAEIGRGKSAQRMMARIWADAGILQVRRERPLLTARGKLLPLHIHK